MRFFLLIDSNSVLKLEHGALSLSFDPLHQDSGSNRFDRVSSERAIRALCQLTQLLCNSRGAEKRSVALYISSLQEGFDWTWDCKMLLAR
jgi:hypothetical protein